MKKILKYKILGLALILSAMVGREQAEQEVSPVVEPNESYPMVTYTPITNTTIAENDTVVLFTITTDRPLDRALTFRASQTGGTADASDYTIINATVQPYTTEAQLIMITKEGWQGEATETAEFVVRMTSLADKYLINPDATQSATISLSITNNNYPVPIHCDLEDGETTKDGKVSLYFDGDVSPVSGKKITLEDRGGYASIWPNLVIDAADLVLEDGEFIVEHPDFIEWTAIRMTVDSGAFVDAQGNVNNKTVFNISVPFVTASYIGDYTRTYEATTDTVEIELIDEDDLTISVPTVSEFDGEDGDEVNFGSLTAHFDLDNYKMYVDEVRTDWFYQFVGPNPYGITEGYYLTQTVYLGYSFTKEASQIVLRDAGLYGNYFDEIAFAYQISYEVIGDIVKGNGAYGTYGLLYDHVMEFSPLVSSKSDLNSSDYRGKIKLLDQIEFNGIKAYRVEVVK